MTRLAVIGPGLLGGSIALAARRTGDFHVAAWARRAEALAAMRQRGIADRVSADLPAVVVDCDLVVLCVPIGAMPALAREILPALPAHAIITDVGSVKAPVVEELRAIFRDHGRFLGSHPMAGSEQTGLQAARADLFDGAVCIVTPEPATDPLTVAAVSHFWKALGCQVRQLSPVEHDEVVALISHLPHLLAAALVNAVAAQNSAAFDFVGPGFRDTTRIASGAPDMWTEILSANRHAVRKSAEAMIEKLRDFLTLLDRPAAGDDLRMNEFLSQAQACRDRLRLPDSTV